MPKAPRPGKDKSGWRPKWLKPAYDTRPRRHQCIACLTGNCDGCVGCDCRRRHGKKHGW